MATIRTITFISSNQKRYTYDVDQLHGLTNTLLGTLVSRCLENPTVQHYEINIPLTSSAMSLMMNYVGTGFIGFWPNETTNSENTAAFDFYLNTRCNEFKPRNIIPSGASPWAIKIDARTETKTLVLTKNIRVNIIKKWRTDSIVFSQVVTDQSVSFLTLDHTEVYWLSYKDGNWLKQRFIDIINTNLQDNDVTINITGGSVDIKGYTQ